MGIRFRDAAATLRTIARIRVRDSGGTLRTIQRVRGRDSGGTLRTLWVALSATVAPSGVEGFGDSTTDPDGNITTNAVTVTPAGTAPFTYLWEWVSGDIMIADSPALATTTFSGTTFSTKTAEFRCKVTDVNGNITYSPNVSAHIEFTP
jgi:hypothetical protein